MSCLAIHRAASFDSKIVAPPSKYHTHRALILASLAEGESVIASASEALDNGSTVRCLSLFGARFERGADGYRVRGGPYRTPDNILEVGNSGSTLHFLLGLASTAPGAAVFTGDTSVRSRPQQPYLEALNRWGIEAWATQGNGRPPIVVRHRDPRTLGPCVEVDGLTSPWTTGLVLLAPLAERDITVAVRGIAQEPSYVAMTTAMMKQFGVEVIASPDRRSYFVPGGQSYRPASVSLPGDIALASFGLALATLTGSRLVYSNLDLTAIHPEAAIIPVLRQMGADLRVDEKAHTVEIIGGRRLKGIEVDCGDSPDMVPILSVLLALAEGKSRITNVAQVRYKECDRLAAMCQLNLMGARVTETPDGLEFDGVEKLHGATLDSMQDHRVQMSFVVAGCVAEGITYVSAPGAAGVSYPDFIRDMRRLGIRLDTVEQGGE